jgi:hypothetical protein
MQLPALSRFLKKSSFRQIQSRRTTHRRRKASAAAVFFMVLQFLIDSIQVLGQNKMQLAAIYPLQHMGARYASPP